MAKRFQNQVGLKVRYMRKYQLLCLNIDTGQVESVRHFQAANDGVAVQLAERWRNNRAAELRRSYELVMRWKAG